MTINEAQRTQTETRIRAAMDRLLSGDIPPGGRCDIKTLASEARISRAALYRTYLHLKVEFDQRMNRLRDNNHQPDPREAQITRLKAENVHLKTRISELTQQVVELRADQTTAISQLAAQHEELLRLRHDGADLTKVITLSTARTP
jgi:chromosome segregation ATPase